MTISRLQQVEGKSRTHVLTNENNFFKEQTDIYQNIQIQHQGTNPNKVWEITQV